MSTAGRKRFQSGAEKRKKLHEKAKALESEINSTHNLFQLGFTRQSTENEPGTSSNSNTSTSKQTATDVPHTQIIENKDTSKSNASENDPIVELSDGNRMNLQPEYQNDIR